MRIRNALAFKRKARKRVGDGLPQRAQTVVEEGRALIRKPRGWAADAALKPRHLGGSFNRS
jgi:hypothetical protein